MLYVPHATSQVDVRITSASALSRFLPIHLQAGNEGIPAVVRAAAVLPDGSGAARTLWRSLFPGKGPAPLSCADLNTISDPLVGGASQPRPGVGVGGSRLQRRESAALVASLWLAPRDCTAAPLAATLPISPRLVFLSAYADGIDPRSAVLPVPVDDVVLQPVAFASNAGIYAALRGAVLQVQNVTWAISGLPLSGVAAINASEYAGALPAIHSLTWTDGSLSTALPPFTLLSGYAYTASAKVTLTAAWAWDTTAFSGGPFPPAHPPPSVGVANAPPETIVVGPEALWSPTTTAAAAPGRSAAFALVTVPPNPASVVASPTRGISLVTPFALAAAGGALPPIATTADITPATASVNLSFPAFASALLEAYPMPPAAAAALVDLLQGGTDAASQSQAAAAVASAPSWCAGIAVAASTRAFNATALDAWALRLVPLAHALSIAATLDAAGYTPPLPSVDGPDLSYAAIISRTQLETGGGGASLVPAATLCSNIAESIVAALSALPINASAFPSLAPIISDPDSTLQYSFRVGTRPLAAIPSSLVASLSPLVFVSPEVALRGEAGGGA